MTRLNFSALHCGWVLAAGAAFTLAVPSAWAVDAVAPGAATKAPAAAASKAPAKAADAKPREGSLGKGSGPLLTREQLRQCIAEQARLKQEGNEALEAQRGLDKERAEVDRLGAALDADKATLDRTSQAAVDGYNERARSRDKRAADYLAASPLFNQRVDKLEAAQETYKKDCADRRYFEDDYDAIKAGK